jgi:hypothetical protein
MWAALWRHLQWRGAALAGVGACWIAYGIGLLVAERPGLTSATAPLLQLLPLAMWGQVWIACGVVSMATGVLRPGRDVLGFAGAAGPPLMWALSFMAAAATGIYGSGWAAVPLYLAVVVLLVAVAALTGRGRRRCTCGEGAPDGH